MKLCIVQYPCYTSYLKTLTICYVTNINGHSPSVQTIREKIKEVKISPGIVPEVIAALKSKSDSSNDLDMRLILDETSISKNSEVDQDTVLGATSSEFSKSDDEQADKVLVMLLVSLRTRKRQIVAYYYTKGVSGSQLSDELLTIINQIEAETKYKIHAISSDMGSSNVGAWKTFGISVPATGNRTFSAPHPCRLNGELRDIFWFPDSSHLLKRIRSAMGRSDVILPRFFCNLKQIPFPAYASMNALKEIISVRNSYGVDFQPKLRTDVISPSGFKVMNVGFAVRVFSPETVNGLRKLAEFRNRNPGKGSCDPKLISSTAHFIELVSDWWQIVSCTDLDSSKCINTSKLAKGISEKLQLMSNVFEVIGFKSADGQTSQRFQPFQAGVVQLNGAIPNFIRVLHSLDCPITKFPLGYLSSDPIESLFGEIKMKYRAPGPAEFAKGLRGISLSTFSYSSLGSNVSELKMTSLLSAKELNEAAKDVKEVNDVSLIDLEVGSTDEADEHEVDRLLGDPEFSEIDCLSCQRFVSSPDGFFRSLVIQAESVLRINSMLLRKGTKITVFIDSVISCLQLEEFGLVFPACHESEFTVIFLKNFLKKRISAMVKSWKSARVSRPDSSVPI